MSTETAATPQRPVAHRFGHWMPPTDGQLHDLAARHVATSRGWGTDPRLDDRGLRAFLLEHGLHPGDDDSYTRARLAVLIEQAAVEQDAAA